MLTLKNNSVAKFIFILLFIFALKITAIAQGPKITSFSPRFGKTGDTITIKGTGLYGGTIQVKLGATVATVITSSIKDTLVKIIVTNGSSGYVKVTKGTGVDSLAGFNYCGTVSISLNSIQKEPSSSIPARLNVGCGVTDTYRIKKVLYATTYNWYMNRGINSNTTITHLNSPGENDTAIQVTFNSGYSQDSICVKGINACGLQSTTLGFVIPKGTLIPPALSSITSSTNNFSPCIGNTIAYTANSNAVSTSNSPISKFSWNIPAYTAILSANSDSSTINLQYNYGFTGGSLSVVGQTCYGIKTTALSSTLRYYPPTPSSITSSSTVFNICRGYVETFYVNVDSPITGQRAASKYRWTIPANTQIVSSTSDSSSITLKFGMTYTNSYLSVQGVTDCGVVGVSKSAFMPISSGCINPVDTIYGPLELCPYFIDPNQTDTIRYTIKSVPGAVSYNWVLPTGVNLYEYADTSILVVVDNNLVSNYGSGRISVCGVSSRGTYGGTASIRLYKTVPVLGNMSGPTSICSYIGRDTALRYEVAKVTNISSYLWEAITPTGVPATGVEFVSRIDSNSVAVKFKNDFISGTVIRISATTPCGTVNPRSVTLYRPLITAPAAIRKTFTPLVAAITNVAGVPYDTLRIRKVTNATNYDWKLSRGTNANITHLHGLGINDTAIVVNVLSGFTLDTVSVAAATDCDKSSFISIALSATALPPAATSISGTLTPCIGDNVTYTASAPAPSSTQAPVALYKWTIPANTSILSAANDSSSIVLKFNTGYAGGSISVRTASALGLLSTLTYKITLKYAVAAPTSISTSTSSANACIGQNITYTAVMPTLSSVQAPAVKYIWTKPNYTTIVGSADSQSITLAFNTGYTGGSLSVKGQSACGVLGTAKLLVLSHTGCAVGSKINAGSTHSNETLTADFSNFILYPNPSSNEFNLIVNTKSSEPVMIKILDMQGRLIKTELWNKNISIGKELKPGIYLFEMKQGEIRKTIKAIKL